MTCPYCREATASPRALHEHLAQVHADQVRVEERAAGQPSYTVTCPRCGAAYSHRVKKAARDPAFLVEFDRQITLVALDMLVHHLVGEHEPEQTGG